MDYLISNGTVSTRSRHSYDLEAMEILRAHLHSKMPEEANRAVQLLLCVLSISPLYAGPYGNDLETKQSEDLTRRTARRMLTEALDNEIVTPCLKAEIVSATNVQLDEKIMQIRLNLKNGTNDTEF